MTTARRRFLWLSVLIFETVILLVFALAREMRERAGALFASRPSSRMLIVLHGGLMGGLSSTSRVLKKARPRRRWTSKKSGPQGLSTATWPQTVRRHPKLNFFGAVSLFFGAYV